MMVPTERQTMPGCITLENDRILAEVSTHGAELVRLYDKARDRELLWNADPAWWGRHAPVLFPNVGRTWGNAMRLADGEVPTSQHGFARDSEFELVEAGCFGARLALCANDSTRGRYPFDFQLEIGYTLEGRNLRVEWNVSNRGEGEMPFTVGGHPAFNVGNGGWGVRIPRAERLTRLVLDPASGCALAGAPEMIELTNGMLPLSENLFCRDALVFDGGQVQEAWLCDEGGTDVVGVVAAGFPNFGIWSKPGAPFVCLEPWFGRTDDCGYEGLFAEKPNATVLSRGQSWQASYLIAVPKLPAGNAGRAVPERPEPAPDPMHGIRPGDVVRHFKRETVTDGSQRYLYRVLATAKHTETGEDLVVYEALHPPFGVWARPASMFFSEVDHAKNPGISQRWRFEKE